MAMSTSRKPVRRAKPAPVARRRVLPLLAGAALALGLAAAGAWWWHQSGDGDALASYRKVQGRWQRGAGDYVIDIREVEAGGKLTVVYLNPRPINVAKAEASMAGGTLKVFVELRDVNYPGSIYQLTYDPAADRLRGTYFQAALRETYEVEFTRLKP
jgi:hypothetical protein